MFRQQRWTVALAGTGLAMAMNSLLAAQSDAQPKANPDKQQRVEERKAERQAERSQADKAQGDNWPAKWHKASELIGLRVDDKDAKKIGDIRNLAINAENGHVRYAIVETTQGTTAVPMQALKVSNKRDRATLDTTADRMKDAPPFNPQGWDTIGEARWGKDVHSFYDVDWNPDFEREGKDFVPAGQVIGGKVENRRGESLGSVKDLVIDTDRNSVAYAVLQFGNEDKLFAAPWQSFTVSDLGKRVVIRGVDRDDLVNGAGFANNRWPGEKDLTWNSGTNFDSRPPTWLYGLKASGGGDGGAADSGVLGGWQTHSKYGQLFDRKTIERIRGTIVRSEAIAPMPAMDPGTVLTIRYDEGKNIVVHLGPEWFVRRQQGEFKEGVEVDVSGSRVSIDGKPAIMATQLRINGRTMTLREDNGVPVWDAWQDRQKTN
jgi:sporulation protein YlmC with PRC-barrel domain